MLNSGRQTCQATYFYSRLEPVPIYALFAFFAVGPKRRFSVHMLQLPVHGGRSRPGRSGGQGWFHTDHEYEFWRQFGLRATFSKQWFAWSDTCGGEIAEGEDDLLILASTVVIDLACHADQQRR